MSKTVSVIIPVYNGETYLGRCIDSVLNQKDFPQENIEILLINDGSKDSSWSIIKDYTSRFPQTIRGVDQPNSGVARARNRGIKLATSEYITFIDQDDYLDPFFFHTLIPYALERKSDVVVGGYIRPDAQGKIIRTVKQTETPYSVRFKISAAWGKLHRRAFLLENDIFFYDNNYGEDILFTLRENELTTRIDGVKYLGYNWFWNDKSVSNTSQRGLKRNIHFLEMLAAMTDHIHTPLDEYYLLQTGIHYLLFSGRSATSGDFVAWYQDIFDVIRQYRPDYQRNQYLLFGPRGALYVTRIAISGFMLLHRTRLVPLFATLYCRGRQ